MLRPISIALVLVCSLASAAAAQSEEDRKAQAKKDVAAGLAAQDAGKYDEAIALDQRAYDAVPHPEILFNLAQAHRLNGDNAKALEYYQSYLAVDPKGRVAKDARKWVKKLEKTVAKEKADAEARAAEEAKKAEEARQAEEARKKAEEEEKRKAEEERRKKAEEKPREGKGKGKGKGKAQTGTGTGTGTGSGSGGGGMKIGGIVAGGIGVLAIGGGVYFGLQAKSISDELSGHEGMWTDAQLAKQSEGKRDQMLMFVATGVGAACVVTGAILYVLGAKQHGSVEVAPAAGDGATVTYSFEF